jgi:exodeoxyribonuclease VII large subunit
VTSRAAAASATALEVEFHDGRLALGSGRSLAKAPRGGDGGQGSLF